MVEVSTLYDLDIYTIAGQYVGKVVDVVLNIRMGTISKFQVKALEPENRNVGFKELIKSGFTFVPEGDEMRTFKEGVLNVDFDKVKAIGDIILIDPQEIQRQIQTQSQPQVQGQIPEQKPQDSI